MEKRELKVGDKVRIKSREELEKLQNRNTTGIVITEEMKSYGGSVGTVEKATSWYCYLSVDGCSNMWLLKWVEPIGGVYIRSVAGRGEDIKKMLTEMGGVLSETMSFNHSNALYFIDPSCRISVVADSVPMGEVIKAEYTELHLPEEKHEDDDEKVYIVVHDNRCMRRLVHSTEEAGRYAKWIQQDKPGTMVEVYEAKLCARIKDELPF